MPTARPQQITVLQVSDGDVRHYPGLPKYRLCQSHNYLIRLGTEWARQQGMALHGEEYTLDRLPDGYEVFETDQPGDKGVVYKRLFGHPSGKFFDSTIKFLPHFSWLMSGMQGECKCHLDSNRPPPKPAPRQMLQTTVKIPLVGRPKRVIADTTSSTRSSSATGVEPTMTSGRAQRHTRAPGGYYAVDEEGTEDVFKDCIRRLEAAKDSRSAIVIDIDEKNSIDWRAEHDSSSLANYFKRIEHQHTFTPRIGELVIWCPNFLDEHFLMKEMETSQYKFYSFKQKCFHGFPAWRGGVITSVPSVNMLNNGVDFPDILDAPKKSAAANISGFRVETFPDPNDDMDKSLSKQYRYVELRCIRPLSQWQMLLKGIKKSEIHPSVFHALTCMTSISLVEKWRFNGQWPNAFIQCRGIYLGSELITVGDVVRLASNTSSAGGKPKAPNYSCTDILLVSSIRLNLSDIQPEHILASSPYLASRSSVTFVGHGLTLDIRRDYRLPSENGLSHRVQDVNLPSPVAAEDIKQMLRPVGSGEYGSWYLLHPPHARYEVSHDQVLGKMYEADAVRLWSGQDQIKGKNEKHHQSLPKLDFDVSGVIAARKYATDSDERLPEPQTPDEFLWNWTDSRVEGLALASVNSQDVGKFQSGRDTNTMKVWRARLKFIDGQPIPEDLLPSVQILQEEAGKRRGRKPGSKLIDGKVYLHGEFDPDQALPVKGNESSRLGSVRHQRSSQMAEAALVNSEDERSSASQSDEDMASTDQKGELGTESNPYRTPRKGQQSLTKAQIMNSVEEAAEFEDDYSSDDEWYNAPMPLARGGTEESAGGDYRPGE